MDKERKLFSGLNLLRAGAAAFLFVLTAFGVSLAVPKLKGDTEAVQSTAATAYSDENTSAASTHEAQLTSGSDTERSEKTAMPPVVFPAKTNDTVVFGKEYDASNAILINVDRNEIVACKDERYRMYPASLTKVMTLIVAVENIEDLRDTVRITDKMVTPYIEQDASRAGFLPGETPSIKDLLYGMILNSGADAAAAVAKYVAGSEEKFVRLMNDKAEEMGLYATHFTNVTGLHDPHHYSTAEDMAMILEYAIGNRTCKKILSAVEYEYSATEQNPEGLTFASTLFSRMYGDEMEGVKVLGGKTGYTDKAGNCIESFANVGGETYILVLCGGKTKWNVVYGTLSAYSVYCAGGEPYESSRSLR
ncbi:MAG: D-alanyl-D-alanine carboxypeptidase [Ruminococcus sp.]|nr:D-alanyl-D-alanine carboxypeptidase [Ruminococcus sp.]